MSSEKSKDVLINYKLPLEESLQKHHFDIKYDLLNRLYCVRNVGTSGLFIRITKKEVSLKNYVVK